MAALAFAIASKGDHGSHGASYAGGASAGSGGFGGFKAVFGRLTFDTDYPDDGYTEASLVALAGLSPYISNIFCIIPLGLAVSSSGELGNPIGWDFGTSTLRAYEGGADGDSMDELPTGGNELDGAVASVLILGR